jgi:predicted kinase
LIIFAGPPCSGKSTLAAELARLTGMPHLSMDATRERIMPDAAHTREDRRVAYRAMHLAAELLLRAGAGVILDAPYGHPEDREELAHINRTCLAGSPGAMMLVECRVSPETAVRRFRERGSDPVRKDLTEELVRRMVLEHSYTNAGLTVDTEAMTIADCVAYLSVSAAGITRS